MKTFYLILATITAFLLNCDESFSQITQFKSLSISLAGANGKDTLFFAFPPAGGLPEVQPSSTTQINPPDQNFWNGAHSLVIRQTAGALGDSLQIKFKPLDSNGDIIMNDSLVIGSLTVAATGALIGTLNKPYIFTITGSFDPSFGVAAIFQQADGGVASRTYNVKHVTNGIYHVKIN
jgi:hypothetical protein